MSLPSSAPTIVIRCLQRHPNDKWRAKRRFPVELGPESLVKLVNAKSIGVQMTFELFAAERKRCAEDLHAVTRKLGELEEAIVLEAGGIEGRRLEAALSCIKSDGERLEYRLLQLEGSIGSL